MSDSQVVHLHGATPRLEDFERHLWHGAYALWIVCSPSSRSPRGLAALTSVDARNGFGFFSIAISQSEQRLGFGAEATGLAFRYIFETFPIRVLLFEVLDDIFRRRFQSGVGKYFEWDGCRKNLVFANGRYSDVHLLSLTRDRWLQYGPGMLERIRRNGNRAG